MYKEVYYWCYRFQSSSISKMKDTAEFAPMLIVTVLQWFNIVAVSIVIKYLFGIKVITLDELPFFLFAICVCLIPFTMNYFFIYRKRQQIFDKYKLMSYRRKLIGVVMTICFIVFSMLLPLILSERLEPFVPQKTELQIEIESLDPLYDNFKKTNDYSNLRLYYKGINELIEKNPKNAGLLQNKEMLECVYGDSLKSVVK